MPRHSLRLVLFVVHFAHFAPRLIASAAVAATLVDFARLMPITAISVVAFGRIIGDASTEVHGYAAARRVIWLGIPAKLAAIAVAAVGHACPGDSLRSDREGCERIPGFTPRPPLTSFFFSPFMFSR